MSFCLLLIYSQSQEVQKKCSKTVNFLQFLLKTHSFLTKNAKKCKFLLIFTPIFSPKTNKSYKITVFTTTNHPIFQNFPQKPLFFSIFRLIFSSFLRFSVFCCPSFILSSPSVSSFRFRSFGFVSDFGFRASDFFAFIPLWQNKNAVLTHV